MQGKHHIFKYLFLYFSFEFLFSYVLIIHSLIFITDFISVNVPESNLGYSFVSEKNHISLVEFIEY